MLNKARHVRHHPSSTNGEMTFQSAASQPTRSNLRLLLLLMVIYLSRSTTPPYNKKESHHHGL